MHKAVMVAGLMLNVHGRHKVGGRIIKSISKEMLFCFKVVKSLLCFLVILENAMTVIDKLD